MIYRFELFKIYRDFNILSCIYDYRNYARQLESIQMMQTSITVHLARAIVCVKKFITAVREVTKTKFTVTISRATGMGDGDVGNISKRNKFLQSYSLAIVRCEVFTGRIDFTVGRWITG